MDVEDRIGRDWRDFDDMGSGDTFVIGETAYMRVTSHGPDTGRLAVNLSTGQCVVFGNVKVRMREYAAIAEAGELVPDGECVCGYGIPMGQLLQCPKCTEDPHFAAFPCGG